jgi:hypothetical protein
MEEEFVLEASMRLIAIKIRLSLYDAFIGKSEKNRNRALNFFKSDLFKATNLNLKYLKKVFIKNFNNNSKILNFELF